MVPIGCVKHRNPPCCSDTHAAEASPGSLGTAYFDRRRKTLVRGGSFGRYAPSGHLVYINKGTLFAVPFDLDALAVRGTPSPVLDQVGYSPGIGSAQFDCSWSGTLVYESGGAVGGELFTVQWLDGADDAAASGQGGQLPGSAPVTGRDTAGGRRGGAVDLRMAQGHPGAAAV